MVSGERIAKLREQIGSSQAALANKFGVSQATVAMCESNKRKVTGKGITQLADFFSVSTEYLYGRDVPKWASTDDVTDLKELPDSNVNMAYAGESLTEAKKQRVKDVLTTIF